MWPLTPLPPTSPEGMVLSLADKYCASREMKIAKQNAKADIRRRHEPINEREKLYENFMTIVTYVLYFFFYSAVGWLERIDILLGRRAQMGQSRILKRSGMCPILRHGALAMAITLTPVKISTSGFLCSVTMF